jgi:hypothetical protein
VDDTTRVITLPPRDRVNIGLAAVAGALAVLAVMTAQNALSPRAHAGATAPPSPTALVSPEPTATLEIPVAQPPANGGKGKKRD